MTSQQSVEPFLSILHFTSGDFLNHQCHQKISDNLLALIMRRYFFMSLYINALRIRISIIIAVPLQIRKTQKKIPERLLSGISVFIKLKS
jgi:hypothetical protein